MFPTVAPSLLQFALALLSMLLFAAAVVEKRLNTKKSTAPPSARSSASIVGILIQSVGFFVVYVGPIHPTSDLFTPVSLLLSLIVLCTGFGGVLLFRSSAKVLGDNWSVVARTRAEHSLITNGPFERVRHPIYLSLLLLLVTAGVGFGHLVGLAIGVPLLLIGTAIRISEEEKLLINQFGDAYRAYARVTPAFIPRLL